MTEKNAFNLGQILNRVEKELKDLGIAVDLGSGCCDESEVEEDAKIKVVCMASGLKESVDELEKTSRDQVVMVRVDNETSSNLDAWVETGAVKSRSAAAALFIREGLKVRADELERLKDALREVESARSKLREQASEIFGGASPQEGP